MKALQRQLKTAIKPIVMPMRMGMSWPQERLQMLLAWAAHQFGGGPVPSRILVTVDRGTVAYGEQYGPLTRHRANLRKTFGHVMRFRYLEDLLAQGPSSVAGCDAIIYSLNFRLTQQQVQDIAGTLRSWCDREGAALVFFDGHDEQLHQWPAAVSTADLYIKKHGLADRAAYQRAYVGRSNLTDYAASTFGFDFSRDHVPRTEALSAADANKIVIGWNIGLDEKIARLARRLPPPPPQEARDIDVMCRASNAQQGTVLYAMRQPATDAIRALDGSFKVLAPTQQVDQREYYREMLRSRMCLSPFGWGELCWRDFEAALCGCLILKPDMSHIETAPNLFQAGRTYVPLRWDYADLAEKVRHYLDHPDEMRRITDAARAAVLEGLTEKWFLDRYREVMAGPLSRHRAHKAMPAQAVGAGA